MTQKNQSHTLEGPLHGYAVVELHDTTLACFMVPRDGQGIITDKDRQSIFLGGWGEFRKSVFSLVVYD